MNIHNITTKNAVVTLSLLAGAVVYQCFFQFFPAQEKLLKDALAAKADAAYIISQKDLRKGIETKDDLLILRELEKIMRVPGVQSVYVAGSGGEVLAHNKIGEWGKRYDDPVTQAALREEVSSLKRTGNAMVFSAPLASSMFILTFSGEYLRAALSSQRKKMIYTLLIVAIIGGLIAGLFNRNLQMRFQKLEEYVRSLGFETANRASFAGKDELSAIANAASELMNSREIKDSSSARPHLVSQAVLEELSRRFPFGLLVLDATNRILTMNEKAKAILAVQTETFAGMHLLDVAKERSLLDIVERAARSAPFTTEGTALNSNVLVTSISGDKGDLQAIVIVFK